MNQPESPTIGVVIVSYNTKNVLVDCLQTLQTCTLPLHIVVVDNASTDDSVAVVNAHFPHVHVHVLAHNRGFAAGTNVGLHLLGFHQNSSQQQQPKPIVPTKPPFILLLNPDTHVHPGAVESLVAFMSDHPRIGLVAPRLLNPNGSIQHAAFRFPTLTMSILDVFPPGEVLPGRLYGSWWHGRYPQEQRGNAPFPIDHPLGACMLARAETIEHVGILDERYFMYSEEIEWCWRIRQAGWAIWHVPHAHVTHIGGAATQQHHYKMLVTLHHSRYLFFHQHYGKMFVHLHRIITQAGMLRAMVQTWYAYLNRRIERGELRARLWAYGAICRIT